MNRRMKKLSLLLLVTLIFNSKIASAQTLVNAGFENWTNVILFNEPKKQIETICEIFKECSFEIKKTKDQKLESEKEFCLVNKDLIDSRFKAKDIAMLSKMFIDLVEDQYGDVFISAVKKFIEQD